MTQINDKLKCKECGQEFTKIDCVTRHAKMVHKLEPKAYYDKWFRGPNEGKCKCCGAETKYWNLENGYREFCSRKCFWKVTTQLESVKEKRKQTCKEKYDSENYMQCKDFVEKSEKTCMQKYNIKNGGGSKESIAKIKATKLANHGDENYNNMEQTYLTKEVKYGDKYYNNFNKTCNTKEIRYGNKYYNNFNKILKTLNETYDSVGALSPTQIPELKKKILGNTKHMTRPEKKIFEFLTNRKISFEYAYDINGKNFDFAIFRDGNLKLLIELDGVYYHGLSEDYNGKHVRGENDCERFSKVPEGVKYIVCDDRNVEACFREITKVYDMDYDEWARYIIDSLPREFPYPVYNDCRLQKDWKHLCEWEWNRNSYVGSSLVRHFHRSIWEARVGNNISPVECWNNKELLERTVKNRIIYASRLSSQSIAEGFNVCKIAPKVSVFNPMLAKHLVQTYLSNYEEVFDPFSGFSGRMLGTCACGKKYIGCDINRKHVLESKDIINYLKLGLATVYERDLFDLGFNFYPDYRENYECLFTCPPYRLKEIWNDNETDMDCDQWIDECIKRFNCKKYLFVVDKTEKYKENIVEEIKNNSHFGSKIEYVILI